MRPVGDRADGIDRANGPDEAALAVAARHALHDEALVVALATGTLDPADDAGDMARARALIDRCAACLALHADIGAIGDAIRADARGTIAAPRDFRLSADDARRLGGFVRVDGFLARLRRSMTSFAKPLGASMATLGIVGILVGSTSLAGGTAMSVPEDNNLTQQTDAPVVGAAAGATGNPKASDDRTAYGPASIPPSNPEPESDRQDAFAVPESSALVFGGSAVLIVVGLLLLVVGFRRGSRRERRADIP
jgi:hypothetical protein